MAKRKAGPAKEQPQKVQKPQPPAKRARFSNPPPPAPSTSTAPTNTANKSKTQAEQPTRSPVAPKRFIVSAGSYERLLYGLECQFVPTTSTSSSKKKQQSTSPLPYSLEIQPIFSFPAHLSSLRTVASSSLASPYTGSERKVGGKYLVSGGADEVIKVWDLQRRKEVGMLEGDASGTITCLRFCPQRNMLLSASSDSTISLYRVRDWVLLRALKGHKGRVNSVDPHPEGRVALSVGVDRNLRMWDLVAGKSVATLKLGVEGDVVRWNTNGTKFAVICGTTLTVYGIDMSIHHILTATSRFHDLRFCHFPLDLQDPSQREYLFVGCEDGKVRVFDVSNPKPVKVDDDQEEEGEKEVEVLEPVAMLMGHTNRIKMMDLLEVAIPSTSTPSTTSTSSEDSPSTVVITTVSSDGKINLYDLNNLTARKEGQTKIQEIEPSASHDTDKTRLTCVSAIGLVEKKNKGGVDGGEENGEEEEEESDDDEEDDDEEEDGEGEFEGIEIDLEGEEDEDEDEEEDEEE